MTREEETCPGLAGRVAIVTGASRNIGRAIAVSLGASGARVLVHANQDQAAASETARLVSEAGGEALVALGDLTDAATPGKLVAKATKTFKGLDIVVNNAAIRPEEPFADITYAAWRQVLAVCLDSAFVLSQAALPLLRTSDQATIVNVGGLTAHTGAAHRAHVIAAKAGLVGLTRAMAHDLGADGVTVNCVAPGLVETDRSRAGGTSPRHHATRTNLVSRRGTPGEIAAMVRFLCGADARYVTGQIIHVNGGAYCG